MGIAFSPHTVAAVCLHVLLYETNKNEETIDKVFNKSPDISDNFLNAFPKMPLLMVD
jgi:hypothetical protein